MWGVDYYPSILWDVGYNQIFLIKRWPYMCENIKTQVLWYKLDLEHYMIQVSDRKSTWSEGHGIAKPVHFKLLFLFIKRIKHIFKIHEPFCQLLTKFLLLLSVSEGCQFRKNSFRLEETLLISNLEKQVLKENPLEIAMFRKRFSTLLFVKREWT